MNVIWDFMTRNSCDSTVHWILNLSLIIISIVQQLHYSHSFKAFFSLIRSLWCSSTSVNIYSISPMYILHKDIRVVITINSSVMEC